MVNGNVKIMGNVFLLLLHLFVKICKSFPCLFLKIKCGCKNLLPLWHKSHMPAQTLAAGLKFDTCGTLPTRCCSKSPHKRSKTAWDAQVTEAHNISKPPGRAKCHRTLRHLPGRRAS